MTDRSFLGTFSPSDFTLLDTILAVLLLYSLAKGFRRGFIVELLSFSALIIGLYCSVHFSYFAAELLVKYTQIEEAYVNIVSFALTFIIVLFGIRYLGKFITRLANMFALGILNKLLGAFFSFLKITFLLSIGLVFMISFNLQGGFLNPESIDNSVLFPYLEKFGQKILPSVITKIQEHTGIQPESAIP